MFCCSMRSTATRVLSLALLRVATARAVIAQCLAHVAAVPQVAEHETDARHVGRQRVRDVRAPPRGSAFDGATAQRAGRVCLLCTGSSTTRRAARAAHAVQVTSRVGAAHGHRRVVCVPQVDGIRERAGRGHLRDNFGAPQLHLNTRALRRTWPSAMRATLVFLFGVGQYRTELGTA